MGHGNPLCFVYVLTCENFSLRLLTKQITRQGPTPVGPVTFSSSSFRPSEELTKLTMAYATTQGIVLCVLLFGELAAAAEKGGCCPSTVHTVASPGSPRPRRPRVFLPREEIFISTQNLTSDVQEKRVSKQSEASMASSG